MIGHFRFMFPDLQDGIDGEADYERDVLTLDIAGKPTEFALSHVLSVLDKGFHILPPESGWKKEFGDVEKKKLRPIAETLAMLDGNAFLTCEAGAGKEWYEMYLSSAHAIYESNGGDTGWAGEASFAKPYLAKPAEETK